jgi:uncharacterized membrane protein
MQPVDIILDFLSATILILMIAYVAISYSELPDIIPSHFNGKGEIDGYSEKLTLWFLPAISIAMFVGLFVLNKYPHMHNYMVNITEENALKNYRLSTRIVRITNVFVMLLFGVISYSMIQGAQSENFQLGSWLLPAIIGFSVLLPIGILNYSQKINKN